MTKVRCIFNINEYFRICKPTLLYFEQNRYIIDFPVKPKNRCILLIESNDVDNFVNRKILEQYGVQDITSFNDVQKALQHLETTHVKYDYIFVHLHMFPVSGLEFIQQLRRLGYDKNHGQICIITSSIDPKDESTTIGENIKFIIKPLTIELLRDLFGD